jgi:hypothetical protein
MIPKSQRAVSNILTKKAFSATTTKQVSNMKALKSLSTMEQNFPRLNLKSALPFPT